jgi:hypothetical protein
MKPYHTVILDAEKFSRWLEARRANGARISASQVAREIGYGASYISQLLNRKADIEASGRFIGSLIAVFNLQFDEVFSIVPVVGQQTHQQDKARSYKSIKDFRRQNGNPPFS